MQKSTTFIPITITFAVVVFLFILTKKSAQIINQQAQVIDSLQVELDYYHSTYHYRVGTIYDEYGNPKTIRALSIDDGESWIVISRHREVLQSRYLGIKYPNVDPDSLQKVY